MNFLARLFAHGDMGIPALLMELFAAVCAACLFSGILLLVNALLILSLRVAPAAKAKRTAWWVLYTLLWAAFMMGAFDRLSFELEGRILFCMIIPSVIFCHFVVLSCQKIRSWNADTRADEDRRPPA